MATRNSRNSSQRRPTKRAAARPRTSADAHYSKLTRRSTIESTSRRNDSAQDSSSRRRRDGRGARQGGEYRAARRPNSSRRSSGTAGASSRAQGYVSLTHGAQRRVYGNRSPRRRTADNLVALLVGIAVILAVALGGVLFWSHRSVRIVVNGSDEKIRVNSSLDTVYESLSVNTRPGNYVSVGGNLLEEDKGYAYTASVDGKQLTRKKTNAYRIHGGETIEFTDGGDRTEKYDVTYREVQPKLVFEGGYGAVSFIKQWGKVGKQEIRTGKESGETVDGDWVEELRDCIVMTKNISPADGQKLVALTFDDGPAATYTEAYLDILESHGAKATFFNLSSNETEYPEIAQKVAASGNQICSHTNQHLSLSGLSQADLIAEITTAHDTILSLTGVDTSIVRPPYGDFTQNCWLLSQGVLTVTVLWNQDSVDWTVPGSDVIVENALVNVQPGSIILMHDGGGDRSQDIEALPRIIERLQQDGYTLVTLSELMASDPDIPAEIAEGSAQKPADAIWPTEIGETATEQG